MIELSLFRLFKSHNNSFLSTANSVSLCFFILIIRVKISVSNCGVLEVNVVALFYGILSTTSSLGYTACSFLFSAFRIYYVCNVDDLIWSAMIHFCPDLANFNVFFK